MLGQRRAIELILLAGILVLAALLRLPGLDQRGQWDSDQGRDLSVLHAMVTGGPIPLLGPSTSIGGLHHGALYDYLLTPIAAVSGSDPMAVTGAIAIAGIAAVAGMAWLGRLVGGAGAGLVAGLLAALSPSLIDASVTLWEPSLIPLASAIGLAGVLQARRTGLARWWVVAGLGIGAALQLHVLDALLIVPLAWAVADDLRSRRRAGLPTRALRRGAAGALAVILLGYVPLAIHELTSDFSETRALLAYVGGAGSGGAQAGILERIVMVVVRTLTWPFAGLVTDRPAASLAALALVIVLGGAAVLLSWRRRGRGAGETDGAEVGHRPHTLASSGDADRWPVAWLLGTLGFAALALAVLAPSLAVVTPGLPNDHYHAFLDPVVLALVGTGAARLWQVATSARPDRAPSAAWLAGRGSAVALPAVLALVAVTASPPAVSPDGGWRLADAAAGHIADVVNAGWPPDEPRLLVSLPAFKPDDAMRFPLARHGIALPPPVNAQSVAGAGLPVGVVIVVCDPLFDDVTGVPCGSLAEDSWLSATYPPSSMQLVERFHAGSRRIISIYAPSRLAAVP
ncbi:MAG TPA: glycosyltransferase family 39 protein [Candidatus Limnocylindrales bacterium]